MADRKISDATPTTPQPTDRIPIARPGSKVPLSVTVEGLNDSPTLTGVVVLNGELVSPLTLPAIDYPTINLTATVTDTGTVLTGHGAGMINVTATLESLGPSVCSSQYYGLRSRFNIGAGNTGDWTSQFGNGGAYIASSSLAGATGTVNTLFGTKVSTSSAAAGLTITNAFGVWQCQQAFTGPCTNSVGGLFTAGGGVNNCDLLLGEPVSYPAPPAGTWTIFSRNTAPSYFSGPIQTAPTFALFSTPYSLIYSQTGDFSTASTALQAIQAQPTYNATLSPSTSSALAINANTLIGAGNTQDWSNGILGAGAIRSTVTFAAGATGTVTSSIMQRAFTANASAMTLNVVIGYQLEQTSNTGGGSILNNIGALFRAGTVGATFNTDLFLGTGAFGTGNWALYSTNAAPSKLSGPLTAPAYSSSVPVTISATTYTMTENDSDLIVNGANCVVTLLSAASHPGRELHVKTIGANTLASASSNVAPLASVTPGTAILAATPGKWARLKSDGTNWVVMAAN